MSHADLPAVAPVLVDDEAGGQVRVLTINRHDKRNALDLPTCQALTGALRDAQADGVRSVVITGAGSAFCAGADLSGGVYAQGFYQALVELMSTIQRLPIIVIAAVNGPAVGAGMQLAMACDVRVVDERASFRVPVVDVGLALDEISVAGLISLIGGARARNMLLTSAPMNREQALACGFALCAGDLRVAGEVASACAAKAPLTVKHLKMEFASGSHEPFDAAAKEQARLAPWSSADAEEARRARREKRAPRFRGE